MPEASKTIFRSRHDRNYTVVSNELLCNPNLSGKAKWILLYLLSKPADWETRVGDIVAHGTDGRNAVLSGIRELKEAGYLRKVRVACPSTGRVLRWETHVDPSVRAKQQYGHPIMVPNNLFEDNRLSLAAKELLVWLLSHNAQDWPSSKVDELNEDVGRRYGQERLRRMLRELKSCGYCNPPKANKYNALKGKAGYIYLIGPNRLGEYKIGATTDPRQRLKAIKSSHGKACEIVVCQRTDDMGRTEESLHKSFADRDRGGEWFDLPPSQFTAAIHKIINNEAVQ